MFIFHERKKWKCLFFFHDWLPLDFVFRYNISVMQWEINSKQSVSTWVNLKKIKSSRKKDVMWTWFKFWPMKIISRKQANGSFIMACLQIFQGLLSLATFFRVHSNSEQVSYLSWQNTYPNLETTRYIKLKFFLWTELLENILFARYLVSVAAPLNTQINQNRLEWSSNLLK